MKDKTMGERIAFLRRKNSMTQEELAEKLGVSAQAVSKWENNVCCPDIALLPKIAALFEVSTDMLLGADTLKAEEVKTTETAKAESEHTKHRFKRHRRSNIRWQLPWIAFVLMLGSSLLWNALAELGLGFWEICLVDGIIAVGIGALLSRVTPFSLGLFALGIVYHLVKFDVIEWADKYNSLIFPALIILFGLSLQYRQFFPKKRHVTVNVHGIDVGKKTEFRASEEGGILDYSLRFSDNRYTYNGEELCGGDINVSFGDAVIDLTQCKTVAEGAKLYANVSFGEATLIVPKHIRIINNDRGTYFASGTETSGSPDSDAKPLLLETSVSFGSFVINYK